ncbi:Plasmodium variant antigen protein Cir/Yir/Bir, putative [Plasmodium berghei]|uniref:Plasmodium variant antigen protein Cir/Yir/Bir, putative n=1 Tax=Plasmodium berghei TaxID=5821 RepID=A0A1C6WB63_PLABE|nr:Plasmodium variant antigen protein Cir/Yir/Bir, putative [Plasmodium berghei]SCL82666.1 Plasmodium variant antigen protein Cir/Yir/Bir, putative [Plasmodium berghei]SCL83946.1 Plasmodium variant antigen protein Cir/Yir/Bir, putative [Plasmodium berghei]
MNDTLCLKFDVLRVYLPDDLNKTTSLNFDDNSDFKKYCPENDSGKNECNNNFDKITAGFLWLLEHCYSISQNRRYNENNTNAFFLYMISWFSYKLKQNSEHSSTKIKDFYTNQVNNSGKYNKFISDSSRYTDFKEFIDKRKDFLNINIKDMSKFYDAFKLLCNMYGNVAKNQIDDILLNNSNDFVKKYTELKDDNTIEDTVRSKIVSTLLTDYNNLKTKCKNCPSLREIKTTQDHVQISKDNSGEFSEQASAQTSRVISSSPIGNKFFTVLSIFSAIAFFLGISHKYSLFGFRKRAQKQYLREKIKNIKKRMNN